MAKNGELSYGELRRRIKDSAVSGAYIFYGEEHFLLEHSIGEFKRVLLPGGGDFNLRIFRGKTAVADISEAVDSLPAFAEKTLTIVYDLDIFSLGEGEAGRFAELISDLPEYTVLVFVFDTIDYKPDGRKKSTKLIKDKAAIINFKKQEAAGLIKGITKRFAALDREISPADAEYLIFLSGGLMTNIIGEISKIAAYSNGKRVTRSEIDAVAVPVTEAAVFSLSDAVAVRDFEKAVKVLDTLINSKEEPIMLVALLGRQMRQLYSAKLASKKGKGTGYLAEMWGMRSEYPARIMMKNAEKVSLPWCRKAVKLCAETDIELKSTSPDKRLALEMLIMRLAQK